MIDCSPSQRLSFWRGALICFEMGNKKIQLNIHYWIFTLSQTQSNTPRQAWHIVQYRGNVVRRTTIRLQVLNEMTCITHTRAHTVMQYYKWDCTINNVCLQSQFTDYVIIEKHYEAATRRLIATLASISELEATEHRGTPCFGSKGAPAHCDHKWSSNSTVHSHTGK